MAWSLLIKGGTVVDGSGAPSVAADVAVEGDRIAAVGSDLGAAATRVINAKGLMVAPGFIDIHSHSDLVYDTCPGAESKVRQGVTTEVVGMCGFSPGPIAPGMRETVRDWIGGTGGQPPRDLAELRRIPRSSSRTRPLRQRGAVRGPRRPPLRHGGRREPARHRRR